MNCRPEAKAEDDGGLPPSAQQERLHQNGISPSDAPVCGAAGAEGAEGAAAP